MQQPTLQVHGSSNNDNVFMIDNVQIQHIGFGGNQTGFYFNDGLMDEISYQTSSLPAEAPVGGVQINMIPRDGGNQFHGGMFVTGANESMQSDNLDDELVALGFRAQNRVDTVYDFNATLGGPIKRIGSGSSAPSGAGRPTTTWATRSPPPASRRSTTSASPTSRCG